MSIERKALSKGKYRKKMKPFSGAADSKHRVAYHGMLFAIM
jgi:hypothetical protein